MKNRDFNGHFLESRYLDEKNIGRAKRKIAMEEIKMNPKTKKRAKVLEQMSSSEDEEEYDTLCLVCCESYLSCKKWTHFSCTDNDPLYVCKNCVSEYSENTE